MHQSLIASFLALFGVLSGLCFAEKKEVLLSIPEVQDKVVISLPEGHDPQKRYPVVFFYPGLGGEPDTSLIRFHTGPKDWIVVGMGYVNSGRTDLSKEAMAKEINVFHAVKKVVVEKYGGNFRECYAAGFSKGGWLTDAMLQTEPSLAGGIVLGAGKMKQFNPKKTYLKSKNTARKVVFIGIGRSDPNYTYAYHGLLMHREMGAAVTMEIWRDLGHSIPELGSLGLEQWLKLRLNNKVGLKEIAEQKTQTVFDSVEKLSPLDQYFVLRDLAKTPYVKLLGEGWKKRIESRMVALNKDPKVKAESLAYLQKQKALFLELKYKNSSDLGKVRRGYLAIQEDYPKSAEAALMAKDISRVEHLLSLVSKREAEMKPKQKQVMEDEGGASRKSNQGRIPMNPLVR